MARSVRWRPHIWDDATDLHPDTALGPGPFRLAPTISPVESGAAYPDAAETFGRESDIAAALAARTVDWNPTLFFAPNDSRTFGEQSFSLPSGRSGYVWIGANMQGPRLDGLRRLGSTCGYCIFQADLSNEEDRKVLVREGLCDGQDEWLLARHPADAIGAPKGVVRPNRPFLYYREFDNDREHLPQCLGLGDALAPILGRDRLRVKPRPSPAQSLIRIVLPDPNETYKAILQGRFQFRIEARNKIVNQLVIAEIEVTGRLIARTRAYVERLPTEISRNSKLLAPLNSVPIRDALRRAGDATLLIKIGAASLVEMKLRACKTANLKKPAKLADEG